MATRRMRIKAVINVPRGGIKAEPHSDPLTSPAPITPSTPESISVPPSPAPVPSPQASFGPVSPSPTSISADGTFTDTALLPTSIPSAAFPSRVDTPPSVGDRTPLSPKSPTPATWLQRPSPSKSPACLPPSGTILRRSPSPALSRLTNSPGPPTPTSYPPSPVPSYSPHSPVKLINRTLVVVTPTSSVLVANKSADSSYPSSPSPGFSTDVNYGAVKKSQTNSHLFRQPPSPSPVHLEFHSVKSPAAAGVHVTRPSPAPSPVFGSNRLPSTSSSANVLSQSNPTKFATVRKEFLEKLHSGELPERNKMTMLHFTFYNPPNPNGRPKAGSNSKSRSRSSSICSEAGSITSKQVNPLHTNNNNENVSKSLSAPSSIGGSRRTTASSTGSAGVNSEGSITSSKSLPTGSTQFAVEGLDTQGNDGGGSCAASDAGSVSSSASTNSVPGPRVKVGPDGHLIIDEKSLVVETSESQRARRQIEDMEVVSGADYAVGSSGFYRYRKYYRRGLDWTERDTIRFYRALNQCGTDFSMMQSLFPHRTRQELKAKFKREDRKNPEMISKVLASCVFDPGDGFSSDEELAPITDQHPLTEEEVICSGQEAPSAPNAHGGKKKKTSNHPKKKKAIEFSVEQVKDLESNPISKGPGTGKGRKWNTPVEGLVGGKLPPDCENALQNTKARKVAPTKNIKVEKHQSRLAEQSGGSGLQPPNQKKKVRRKKKDRENVPESAPVPPPGMVSIIVAPGVISNPIVTPTLPPPTVSIKQEKADGPSSNPPAPRPQPEPADSGNKRRSRLPKPKPTVLTKPGIKKNRSASGAGSDPSSQPNSIISTSADNSDSTKGVCEDLFRFDATDPLGLKVVPTPVVEAALLDGNEESGREGFIIMDLDAQSSKQTAGLEPSQTTTTLVATPPKKRKRKNSDTDGIPVTTARIVGWDPYGKSIITMATSGSGKGDSDIGGANTEGHNFAATEGSSNKKVKVLPYRVPGPGGGALPPPRQSLAEELEIEIELSVGQSNDS